MLSSSHRNVASTDGYKSTPYILSNVTIFTLTCMKHSKMASITPFKIFVSDEKIKRLQQKLALTDLPSEVPDPTNPWARGVPLSEIKRLALHWQHNFQWRAVESKLNQLPQYTANIEVEDFGEYDVHFVHQRSQVTMDAIPLLVLHGWPSSFLQVRDMLPTLVDGVDGPTFHVVAPSLIDFGFSSASNKVYQLLQVRPRKKLILGRKGSMSSTMPKRIIS